MGEVGAVGQMHGGNLAAAGGEGCDGRDELMCGSCSAKASGMEEATCARHNDQYIEFKCRFCCSIATFFCFGHTHFCEKCHQKVLQMAPRLPVLFLLKLWLVSLYTLTLSWISKRRHTDLYGAVPRRYVPNLTLRVCGCAQWVQGACSNPSTLVQKCSCGQKHAPNGINQKSEVNGPCSCKLRP